MTGSPDFFAEVRKGLLGPVLTQDEVDGCNAILAACEGLPMAFTAYALATAYHETAHTLQPIHENGGEAYFRRMYDVNGNRPAVAIRLGNSQPGDGALFHGRGYVQLTGRSNYRRAGLELGVGDAFLRDPDRLLDPKVAAAVMRQGMSAGWFTGRSFSSFLPETGPANRGQFTNARMIINGQDRADDIAGYALQFQAALQASPVALPMSAPSLPPAAPPPSPAVLATPAGLWARIKVYLGIGR